MLQTSYSVDTRAMRLHCIRVRDGTVLLRRRSDVREIGGKSVWNSSNFVLWFDQHIPQSRSGFFHRYAPKNRKALHRLPLREEHDHHIGVKTLISSVWLRMLQLSLCVLKINSWKNRFVGNCSKCGNKHTQSSDLQHGMYDFRKLGFCKICALRSLPEKNISSLKFLCTYNL